MSDISTEGKDYYDDDDLAEMEAEAAADPEDDDEYVEDSYEGGSDNEVMDDAESARGGNKPVRAQLGADEGIRLQKVLATAGIGSRRACEELIEKGRVKVDGEIVTLQGMRVDPELAVIHVDGERIVTRTDLEHVIINKPRGVLTTMADDRGRECIGDYVADRRTRLFHVGRLDADSEGLLLLTNDGELAHRLTHPSRGVTKEYLAEVEGQIGREALRRLRKGVELEDGMVKVDRIVVVEPGGPRAIVEVTLHEGRNHIVRRLLEEVGNPVTRLLRTSFGPLRLGNLKPGRVRHLTSHEVSALYGSVDL